MTLLKKIELSCIFEKEGQVLVIAANALYFSREFIDKIFNGERIKELSYHQIQQTFNTLKKPLPS